MRQPYFFEPTEPLFFGPPASTFAGETHLAVSQFPSPRTVLGMVRTHLLRRAYPNGHFPKGGALEQLVGSAERLPAGWQAAGPFPARLTDAGVVVPWLKRPAYFDPTCPVHPASMIGEPAEPKDGVFFDDGTLSDRIAIHPPQGFLTKYEPPRDADWISPDEMRFALGLGGRVAPQPDATARSGHFLVRERRSGLAIADDGTALDDHLYTHSLLRFAPGAGLFGWLDASVSAPLNLADLSSGAATAGRGDRTVIAHAVDPQAVDDVFLRLFDGRFLPATVASGSLFWAVTTAPTDIDDPRHIRLVHGGVTARLRALRLARRVTLGGFDRAQSTTIANRQCWEAGSAFLFELEGGSDDLDRAAALRAWNGQSVLGAVRDRQFGMGQVLVGAPLT